MLRRIRAIWRAARGVRVLRPILTAGDRWWWARVIRRSGVVDLDLVRAQGHPSSTRTAIRAYVHGGFRSGMSLNPLMMERLISQQLSDVGRVPALYAYLVNDTQRIETSVVWDAPAHARVHPESVNGGGGVLGDAWRRARATGTFTLCGRTVGWDEVVRAARDGARRARAIDDDADIPRIESDIVLLCRVSKDEDPADAFRLALSFARSHGAFVVLALEGNVVDHWVAASLLALGQERIHVARERPDLAEVLRANSTGSTMVVRGPRADISADDLLTLAKLAVGRRVAPLWLNETTGTIESAGVIAGGYDLLRGHPPEDALMLGDIELIAVSSPTYAESESLHSKPLVVRGPTVRAPSIRTLSDGRPHTVSAQDATELNAALKPLGMSVTAWTTDGPVFRRARGTTTLDDGTVVPTLRWAIKTAAPAGPRGEWWGDTHFARGIADALRRLGQEVVIDGYQARIRPSGYLDDVALALRGPEPIHAIQGTRSLLWIISHPDEIRPGDLEGYDAVFAASAPWAKAASDRFSRQIEPLLQCTDVRRFHPSGARRSDELVFVGTARGIARPSVIEPLRAGIPVTVYGPDWTGWIPAEAIKARGIDNARLPGLYESAGAVLNDHWPAMQREGFVSNRLFDVVAAGGRAISDDVTGISELFGGAVRTYKTATELVEMLKGDMNRLFPEEEELNRISTGIRARHSFDARARTLLDAALSTS